MKIIKLLLALAFMICLIVPSSVHAVSYTSGGSDFITYDTFQSCIIQDDEDCTVWKDWFTIDYRRDDDEFRNLLTSGTLLLNPLTAPLGVASIFTETGRDYTFFLEYRVYNGTVGKYQDRTNNVTIVCESDCNFFNCSDNLYLNIKVNESGEIPVTYQEINLQHGDFLRCNFYTYYKNTSVALSSGRINYRIWQPTYQTTTSEPDRRRILNLEAEVETLNNRVVGEYQTTADYILSVIKVVVQINIKLWVFFYWAIIIGVIVGVFSLLIYILYWLFKHVKKL